MLLLMLQFYSHSDVVELKFELGVWEVFWVLNFDYVDL
jgi:hypothetical protein